MEILVAYLHFVSILLTAGCLTAELAVCRPGLDAAGARRLGGLDRAYFSAALVALATGLLRLLVWGKGAGFYLPNPIFWVKMVLYVAIALVSVRPTMLFIRWGRDGRAGALPPGAEVVTARRLIHLELALLVLMPLAAVLMARGVGR